MDKLLLSRSSALVYNNMKEDTIMAKKYIIDQMNSHKLKPHTIEIKFCLNQ